MVAVAEGCEGQGWAGGWMVAGRQAAGGWLVGLAAGWWLGGRRLVAGWWVRRLAGGMAAAGGWLMGLAGMAAWKGFIGFDLTRKQLSPP